MGLRALLLVGFACAAIIGLGLLHSWDDRAWRLREIQTQTDTLARSLVQHAEDSLGLADLILVGLVERLETEGTGPAALERLSRVLALQLREPGSPRGLFIHDAEGRWLLNSAGLHPDGATEAERAWFAHHRANPDRGAHLGPPVQGREEGAPWVATLSRRVELPDDGRFAGVALATIDLSRFAEHASGFAMGRKGALALFREDGTLLMRLPPPDAQAIGRPFAITALFRDRAGQGPSQGAGSQPDGGTRRYVSPVDGVDRIASHRRGERYPVVAVAALSAEEALAPWVARATRSMAGILLLAALVAVIGRRLMEQMRRRQEAEVTLREREESFRLLAENCCDMVSRIGPDGLRRYVSPAARQILGREPEALVGRPAIEAVHPDDIPAVQEVVARLRGGLREAVMTYRVRRPDGTEIWVEAAMRVAFDPRSGEPDGVVAISRDVTERKVLEARLAELATTDGLTGLFNRRALDEALDREWRRAFREGSHLSVLLLDVDHFKAFNDSHGHGAGDACLREIAAAIGAAARRPSDLAARYGGEEFAFLLPGTEAAGALEVAERIRAAVQGLGIPHATSPEGSVTLSIGAASCQPRIGTPPDAPGALVAAADAALYGAKRSGRNRVRLVAEGSLVRPPAMLDAVAPEQAVD